MSGRTLKHRIFASLAGAIALVLGIAVALVLVIRHRDLGAARAEDRIAIERFQGTERDATVRLMEGVLVTLQTNPAVAAAFAERDRARLLALTRPLFETLVSQQDLTHLYFLGPDLRVLLRVHEPEQWGDTVERRTVTEAARAQRPVSGLEITPLRGLPALRVVAPWRVDGELVGYVELANDITGLTRRVRDAFGVHAFLVLSKAVVNREAWEADMRAAGRTPDWDRYPATVLVEGTVATPRDLDARFAALSAPGEAEVVSAELDGRSYQGESIALRDSSDRILGELVFLSDRSRLLGGFNRGLIGFAAVSLLVGVGLWLVLRGTVMRQFVRPLQELVTVTEGASRGELAGTMLADREDEMGDLGRAVNRLIGDLRSGQEERTRKIVDAAHDAVVITDGDGVIVDWNARAQTIFGWTREEAVGMTLTETMIPEEDHGRHLSSMRRFREGGGGTMLNRLVEVTARRRSGERFPAELTITAIPLAEGVTLAAFIRDITDRRAAESALRESEERFRRLVETTHVVPWEADSRTTRVTYVGPQAEPLLGFPLDAWYEEGFWVRQVHAEDREHALTQLVAAARGVEAVEYEYRMVHRAGHAVWVRDIVAAETTDGGAVLRGFRFDVTEQRRLEEELLQSQKMEAIGRLAGGIAHDFNNILTAILGYSALVETSFPEDAIERADVREIRRAASQAADLTQQLLAFARKQVIRPRVLVVDDMVRRLEKMMARLIGEDVLVVTRIEAEGAAVWVDPGRLEQALVNLLFNARDAMPKGGTITLATGIQQLDGVRATAAGVEPGPYARISVSDTGIGMDQSTLAHAFEPFFTTKPEGKGTGLGLSTAYGVIHQASGFLEAESVPGQGSSFHVFLPLAKEAVRAEDTAAPEPALPTGNETILVAEDEPQVRKLTERSLLRAGYRVLLAQHGAEAVERSREYDGPIHLLVTDVVMPVMGGVRAADTIRAERPGIRVLFVSGYSEEGLFRDGVEEGVHFLAKPFTPPELDRKVREVLDGVMA